MIGEFDDFKQQTKIYISEYSILTSDFFLRNELSQGVTICIKYTDLIGYLAQITETEEEYKALCYAFLKESQGCLEDFKKIGLWKDKE
jgi:hypothetical protein